MITLLLRQQITRCNLQLLQLGIARNIEHFHPIQQWTRNVMNRIRRRHKHYVGQIERHLDKVIAKRIVLLRIKHLKQRRRWITSEIRGHLIDFIEKEYRVKRSCGLHALDDSAWHRSHISAAMSANFSLISYTAQ
ncbi:hypothetical protein D3C77_485440 [compost metagenome]